MDKDTNQKKGSTMCFMCLRSIKEIVEPVLTLDDLCELGPLEAVNSEAVNVLKEFKNLKIKDLSTTLTFEG